MIIALEKVSKDSFKSLTKVWMFSMLAKVFIYQFNSSFNGYIRFLIGPVQAFLRLPPAGSGNPVTPQGILRVKKKWMDV